MTWLLFSLFGSEFTIMKGVGVLLCVAGVCLIAR